MPKKTKNRSSKQAKQHRQARALTARQDKKIEAILDATEAAFPAALEAGQFRALHGDQEVVVTLEDILHRVNADLAGDGETPLGSIDDLTDMLRDEILMGLLILHPDDLWRMPEDYLPRAGQA
ncbi:hypothetical protein [Streptomyces sp. NPDC008092]|uniref:hypothetical protein n=1 Tax=Streptomyces sp. NPDC008092 TaxID=3364808 RepID=UPI0036EC8BE7